MLKTPPGGNAPSILSDNPRASTAKVTLLTSSSGLSSLVSRRWSRCLWGRVDQPLRCSVVGVEVCRRIRKKCFSRGRGKKLAKRLLDTIEQRFEDGVLGILDNISGAQVARAILLESTIGLGLKRGESNLSRLAHACGAVYSWLMRSHRACWTISGAVAIRTAAVLR